MSIAAIDHAGPFKPTDRSFFLLVLAAIWGGVLAGFVPDSLEHLAGKHVAFAPIVHLHAVTFVGWMVLLTTQFSLIRVGRVDLHKRLGMVAAGLIPIMLVLGPVTSFIMSQREFGTPDGDPAFLILPTLSAICFAAISFTGLAYRKTAAIHKRLMLLGTVVLSDAGFARWLGPQLGPLMGHLFGRGFIAFFVPSFVGSILIMAVMLGYDLATRRRPYPVVLGAMGFVLLTQVIIALVYINPAWKPIATHLLGH
jgi:hypothetical protein